MARTSDRPLALSTAHGPRRPDRPKAERFSRKALQAWMQYMEDYGQAWLEDTGRDFYSQEYWYLVTMALVRHWQGKPLNVSDACRSMKTGSSKTRENRLALEDNQGKWGVSFGIKNLTDEAYITHGFDLTAFPGVGLAYYGEPLTYRFGVRYRFL